MSDETRFTNDELNLYYGRLTERRRALLSTAKSLEAAGRIDVAQGADISADLGAVEGQREVISQLIHHGLQEIQEIEEALARIDRGTFGSCENCDEDIPTVQLDVLPQSRFCSDCKAPHWTSGRPPAFRARPSRWIPLNELRN